MKNISKLILKLRKLKKISQTQFSKKYKFSSGHISKIEKNKIINPRKNTIKKLNKILKSNKINF